MDVKKILVVVCVLLFFYVLIKYMYSNSNTLTSVMAATTMQKILATSLVQGTSSNASNFTYSIWFYINDWNYKYGETKVVFGRMGSVTSNETLTNASILAANPCPIVTLGTIENNLSVLLAVYPGEDAANPDSTEPSVNHTCNVSNIPIQKWVNLLISTYGRTLDLYLDGKLVQTCVLPGIAKINPDANVYVTPSGGFAGWTAKFQYFPNSTDPQTAWDIYKSGYSNNALSNLFGNYEVKVSFTNNGAETSSFTI